MGAGSNVVGPQGNQGNQGPLGSQGNQGPTGPEGSGGGVSTVYSNTIRYEITSSSDKAQVLSTGNVYGGLSWVRGGTTLTVTSNGHGLSNGDYVVLRNMNVDYVYVSINSVTTNTFRCTVQESGGTSGTEGAYIPAMDVSTLSDSAVTIESPSAGNVQLLSMSVFINDSQTDPKSFQVPSNAINNGAGKNNDLASRIPPNIRAYNVGGSNASWLSSTVATFSTNSNYNQYGLSGGLDTFGAVLIQMFF